MKLTIIMIALLVVIIPVAAFSYLFIAAPVGQQFRAGAPQAFVQIPRHLECNTETMMCEEVDGEGSDLCQRDDDCVSHLGCQGAQCVPVLGEGTDQCDSNSDCMGGDTIIHFTCIDSMCVEVAGPGDNTCSDHNDCGHLDCLDEYCVWTAGGGQDLCGDDSDCGNQTNVTHTECDYNDICIDVDGPGDDECANNWDCIWGAEHYECDGEACVLKSGPGDDECTNDADCANGTNHTECQGDSCVEVAGSGVDECAMDSDCTGAGLSDITVSELTVEFGDQVGNEIEVTIIATISNIGVASAEESTTSFYIAPEGGEKLVPTAKISPGSSLELSVTYLLNEGREYIGVVTADWYDEIDESDEDNNWASI